MRKLILAGAAVAAVGAAALTAGNVAADETLAGPPGSASCVSTTGAKACFQARGDAIWIKDTKGDRHHAVGVLIHPGKPPIGFSLLCHNYKGSGHWKKCGHSDLPENETFRLRAERWEGKTSLNASRSIEVRS